MLSALRINHRLAAIRNHVAFFVLIGGAALLAPQTAQAHNNPTPGIGLSRCACYAPGSPVSDDFVLNGGKWGASSVNGTPGGVVTYSFASTTYAGLAGIDPGPIFPLDTFMPAGFKQQIVDAFNVWSTIANIQFVEVADNGLDLNAAGATGDIRIGGQNLGGAGGVLAHAFSPPPNGTSAAGDLHFDSQDTWTIGFNDPNPNAIDIFQVAAHEIGHSIGLAHTNVANSLMNPTYSEAFSGPQADDIAGAQAIYGAAPVTVPEASTVLLLPVGALLAGGVLRRRKNA